MEKDFGNLLKDITPSPHIVGLVEEFIEKGRDLRFGNHEEIADNLQKQKLLIERKVE